MRFYAASRRFMVWLSRHHAIGASLYLVLYAALIAFGAYASSSDAFGTDSPWPGALAAAIGLPLVVLLALPLLGNGPTDIEREQHELNYEDQHRW